MRLGEECLGPSEISSEGAVLIKEFTNNIYRDRPGKRNISLRIGCNILGTSSGKHQAFLRDIQNRSVEIVQHQARLSGINPDYASPNLMQEARREYQTPIAFILRTVCLQPPSVYQSSRHAQTQNRKGTWQLNELEK